ncbi:MAG: methylenetetrahydrofolate reductase [NAD(P)H] [Omnitrophica WOR_2 bacterium GWA2_47_8]|nr:MAG: methylenetetrahydrofolate reductase [NAD(P)H] [Omnitrophica WOR_2 bacterium GWA2_47_8]
MKKLPDIFKTKEKTFSFELFPPKTEEGYQKLLTTVEQLCRLKPDFISCTYGAGGGNRDKTLDIVEHIQKKHNIISVAHLTCVLSTKEEIKNIITDIKNRGINNILALRGDPPKEQPDWQPGPDNFKYSSELTAFIRKLFGPHFGIGVAGFPEGHILCRDKDRDAQYLKLKIDAGADFVITQIFFDNTFYFEYIKRLKKLNVHARVIPGILPITDYQSLLRFCALCGATVPQEVKRIFEPIQNDKDATLKEGINFAVRQCQELLKNGAPGIHFYCLNKLSPTDAILTAIR